MHSADYHNDFDQGYWHIDISCDCIALAHFFVIIDIKHI